MHHIRKVKYIFVEKIAWMIVDFLNWILMFQIKSAVGALKEIRYLSKLIR